MRRYHTWMMTLGLAAAAPGVVWAGPFGLFKSKSAPPAATQTAQAPPDARTPPSNQEMANRIAGALKQARLRGNDIKIQYQGGVAILGGSVQTAEQRQLAQEVAAAVPGVRGVDNRLSVGRAQQAKAPPAAPRGNAISQVAYETEDGSEAAAPEGGSVNQQMAENIAAALQEARFVGYDIGIAYKDGIAILEGSVANPQARAAATSIVSQVPGVQRVDNQLTIQAVQPTRYAQGGPQDGPQNGPPGAPQAPPEGMRGGPPPGMGGYGYGPPPGMNGYGPPPGMGGPMGGPPGGPMGTPGAAGMMYDQPNLPDYAWPSYASYPNYAAVTYPQQYSASAWPYIGPFYPYPQVPLGWRKVQLEWDDGYWQLNFRPRTDRWWWFMDYRNW